MGRAARLLVEEMWWQRKRNLGQIENGKPLLVVVAVVQEGWGRVCPGPGVSYRVTANNSWNDGVNVSPRPAALGVCFPRDCPQRGVVIQENNDWISLCNEATTDERREEGRMK
jgi:hypothetical protein